MPSANTGAEFSVELKIDGSVNPDVHVEAFTIRETLSQPFELDVEVSFKTSSFDTSNLLGATISLAVDVPHVGPRHWNGYVAGASLLEAGDNFVVYSIRAVPKLWFLSRRSECRIFDSRTTMEIVASVLSDAGINLRDSSSGGREKRNWCAQYRETDLNFVSRLLEDAGVCYFFEHAGSADATLVLADSLSGHQAFKGVSEFEYGGAGTTGSSQPYLVEEWSEHQVVASGKYTLGDYDFEKAVREEGISTGKSSSHQFAGYGIADYHVDGDFSSGLPRVVSDRAAVRIEELQSHRCRKFGRGPLGAMAVGSLFTLKRHPVKGQNVQHLVISTKVSCSIPYLRSGSQAHSFDVSFEATPADLPYRPERLTPKPALDGLHTAIVTDNDGAGCNWNTDGPMVKVKFFWGSNADGEALSGWARVAQPTASRGFGAMFLPQIDDEVVVSFLEGDPDRPLVIGSVYHGKNTPFYSSAKQLKQSGIRTSSGNELTFDEGSESAKKIYVEASENLEVKVAKEEKRDCDTYILEAQTSITIKTGSSKIEMKNDGTINITGMNVSIKADGGDVKLSGLNVQATGSVGAKVSGSATAEISSSGQTTVKGSIVMVN